MSRSEDLNNENQANKVKADANKKRVVFSIIGFTVGLLAYNIAKIFGLV